MRFEDATRPPWRIGGIEVRTSLVAHRGPTLGYRLTAETTSLCYLPDHESGLGEDLRTADPVWISGHALARGASLLIHDCQYTDAEYPARRGWGHSSVSDALAFAQRCRCAHTLLFHHDPAHDDARLGEIAEQAKSQWQLDGGEGTIDLALEGRVIDLVS